jgi:hypothetical protein
MEVLYAGSIGTLAHGWSSKRLGHYRFNSGSTQRLPLNPSEMGVGRPGDALYTAERPAFASAFA